MSGQPQAPTGWATRAYIAARARLIAEHRPLDPQWIADYQAEVVAICEQSGQDPREPLELTLVGLATAPSELEPLSGPVSLPGGPGAAESPAYNPRHVYGAHEPRYAHWRAARREAS